MGGPPSSYITYKPRPVPLTDREYFTKVDYMITEEEWGIVKQYAKHINENIKDFTEEMFDKLEKYTQKKQPKGFDVCRRFLKGQRFKGKEWFRAYIKFLQYIFSFLL